MQAWTSAPPPRPFPAAHQRHPDPGLRHRAQRDGAGRAARAGTARIYVCGITPYDATHIGHANTYVAFDLLNRIWRDAGLEVDYVQNVTDVDDPLLERAPATGMDWQQLAERADRAVPRGHGGAQRAPADALRRRGRVDPAGGRPDRGAAGPRRRSTRSTIREFPDLYFAQASDAEFGSLSRLDEAEAHRALRRARRRPGPARQEGTRWTAWSGGWRATRRAVLGLAVRARPAGLAHRVHRDRAGPAGADFDVQGGGSRPGLPAPRDVRRGGPGGHRTAVRAGVRAQRDGRTGRGEDVQVQGQPGASSPGCGSPASTRWRSGWPCSRHHYRDDWMWTDDDAGRGPGAAGPLARGRPARTPALNADEVLVADARRAAARPRRADRAGRGRRLGRRLDRHRQRRHRRPGLVARACDALLGVRSSSAARLRSTPSDPRVETSMSIESGAVATTACRRRNGLPTS